jgi:DNA repair protein RadC
MERTRQVLHSSSVGVRVGAPEITGSNHMSVVKSYTNLVSPLPLQKILSANADSSDIKVYHAIEMFFPQVTGVFDVEIPELCHFQDKLIDVPRKISTDVSPPIRRKNILAKIDTLEWRTGLRTEVLCSRLISVNEKAVSDEDLLTLLLSNLRSNANSRNIAMRLILQFETIGGVMAARSERLLQVAEVDLETIDFLKAVGAAGVRLAREEISDRPLFDAWDKLISYLRTTMAHQTVEQFRVMFLDRRNVLISDEVQNQGTIDHAPVYPREVVKRALELDSSAIIMVHNHPSNHPRPSKRDIEMTRQLCEIVGKLGIVLHDHIIVSRSGHTSFRQMGLL